MACKIHVAANSRWALVALLFRGVAFQAGAATYIIPLDAEVVNGEKAYAHVQPGDTLELEAGTRGTTLRFQNLVGTADARTLAGKRSTRAPA